MKRDNYIIFKVSQNEKEIFLSIAEEYNMSISEFFRTLGKLQAQKMERLPKIELLETSIEFFKTPNDAVILEQR